MDIVAEMDIEAGVAATWTATAKVMVDDMAMGTAERAAHTDVVTMDDGEVLVGQGQDRGQGHRRQLNRTPVAANNRCPRKQLHWQRQEYRQAREIGEERIDLPRPQRKR